MSEGGVAIGAPRTDTGGPSPGAHQPVLEMGARAQSVRSLVVSIWRHRELVATLARKDFFVRYRRASFGIVWAVGLPFIQAMVLAAVFTYVIKVKTEVPLPVFVFTAITAYGFFQASINQAATAIVDGAQLSSRIYFPRAVLPLTAVGANVYALIASTVVLIAITLAWGVNPSVHMLLLVPAALLVIAFTAAAGLVLSALHVYFRDVRYIVQALLLALFYATPIFYPLELVPNNLRIVIMCNPMTGAVELFRKAIGGADPQWAAAAAITCGWTAALLILGLYLQSRWDRLFVDLL